MNWDAIGAGAELLGALGVIISLIYLALQIRQNSALLQHTTEMARTQAAVLSANYGADGMRAIALDADASRIWGQGFRDPSSLAPGDLARFDLLMASQIIHIDVNHFMKTNGVLDPAIAAIWDRVLDMWLRHPRFVHLEQSGGLDRIVTHGFAEHVREKRRELEAAANSRG